MLHGLLRAPLSPPHFSNITFGRRHLKCCERHFSDFITYTNASLSNFRKYDYKYSLIWLIDLVQWVDLKLRRHKLNTLKILKLFTGNFLFWICQNVRENEQGWKNGGKFERNLWWKRLNFLYKLILDQGWTSLSVLGKFCRHFYWQKAFILIKAWLFWNLKHSSHKMSFLNYFPTL